MKQVTFIISCLLVLFGCDSPSNGSRALSNQSSSNFGTTTTVPTTTTTPSTTTGSTSNTGTTTTPGFESCDLSFKYQTTDMGSFGICQSTQNETLLKLKPSMTNTSTRTCLIPTYKDGSGSSMYIGQPQCTFTQANVEVQGTLYKNRTGFESYSLNGVMVMNEGLLNGYFTCMNSYASYRSQACPNGALTNATCDQAARQYQASTCNSFISQYGKYYADIKLK